MTLEVGFLSEFPATNGTFVVLWFFVNIFDVLFQGRAVDECLIADGTRHHRSISVNMREVISELGKFNPTNWTLVLSDFMMNGSNMSLQAIVCTQFFAADVAICLV